MRYGLFFSQGLLDFPGHSGFSKSLSLLGFVFSIVIFCSVLFFRIEAWAQKQRAETVIQVTQMEWESALYRKTVLKVFGQHK